MPFGKFKGAPVEDLPSSYLWWLVENIELREPLKSAIEDEVESRSFRSEEPAVPEEILAAAGDIVRAGYRILSQRYHPDRGGDLERMKRVNLAAEWLRGQLRGLCS
jgi:Putative quorum-sensing-regulated virulence factor